MIENSSYRGTKPFYLYDLLSAFLDVDSLQITYADHANTFFFIFSMKTVQSYISKTICTTYKMSGRSLSVYKDTSASHEYLCTLIKNGHEFCKLRLKRTQIVVQ